MTINGFRETRAFLGYVEKRGLVRHIGVAVSRDFEIAEITRRARQLPNGGPVLVFDNVTDATMPIVTNLTGTAHRLMWSLGLNNFNELEIRFVNLLKPSGPQDFAERLTRLGETSHYSRYAPRIVKNGPCQEVTHNDLSRLPLGRAWPDESGQTLRNVPVFSRAKDGSTKVETGDLLVAAGHAFLSGITLEPQEQRAVALVIGGDLGAMFTTCAPFLPKIDPLVLACGLTGQRVDVLKCKSGDLLVPANAEIVIEGVVEKPLTETNGKFAQANGFYRTAMGLANFKPTLITQRKEALFISPQTGEADALLRGSERVILPILQLNAPEITDLSLQTNKNLAIVAINKKYVGQAQRVMYSLWGNESLYRLKYVAVVDADCDVHNPAAVSARVLALLDPAHDLLTVSGPLDPTDPAYGAAGVGAKIGLDATRKLPNEGRQRVESVEVSSQIQQLVDEKWLEYGLE